MTTQLLATELANLIQESKRKHNDLRQAAEKSLEELKSLRNPSEQTAPEELSQKPNFVNPFIIACGTKNAKFTAIAIACLQRLIVAQALPRSKLNQVLEALMQATSAGLDVQLKILQALPSLVQNYASDLKGNLLVTTLNICFTLQSSKNAIVNHTSAATLQQLVVSVFDKVVSEDKKAGDAPAANDAEYSESHPAATDAYRIFNDLCLMTENQRPEFIRVSGLQQTFGLELIESVITNHATVFSNHPEQAQILRSRVMPLIIGALKGKPNFATTVRLVRILYTILRGHINILPSECGEALAVLTHILDQDETVWKRSLCMEVFRGIFADHALLRRIYAMFDAGEGKKDVLKPLIATFVRLSTEKPNVIGLGHQSSLPTTSSSTSGSSEQAIAEASGMTGLMTGPVGSETTTTGISTQWSSVRVPCIDQLDKTEAPNIPESYLYSLVLACISSVSDGLAKFILPLTVPSETRNRKRTSRQESGRDSPAPQTEPDGTPPRGRMERSTSFKKNPVPLNPLSLEDHPLHSDVKICAAIVGECWPAILATCSTFLYAALDSEYYHGLVRAFQRFAHVAGLLRLSTPRDAFITTLGKAAVPPNVLTACVNAGQPRPQTPSTPTDGSLFSNARGLLSVDNLTPTTPTAEKGRQASFDGSGASLNTRNLLCLRALLNLGIALGPTLEGAWSIILETLQQADFVLFVSGKSPGRTPSMNRGPDSGGDSEAAALMANFGSEVRAVETAASRLIESTADFPNESFLEVVAAICGLLMQKPIGQPETTARPQASADGQQLKAPAVQGRRVSGQMSSGSTQEDQFALAKLGELATINIERLLEYSPEESGWSVLTNELIDTLTSSITNSSVRTRAADILVKLVLEAANVTSSLPEDARGEIQLRFFEALHRSLAPLLKGDREVSLASHSTDIDIHKIILDGLQSIIEGNGETLVKGWDIAFEIIGTIFITRESDASYRRGSVANPILLDTRSARLIRSSFNSLQLICSDFLASLPNSCFLILVDNLYKFCSQDDDLNIALTTVTFFWVLSDFLSTKNESLDITAEMIQGTELSDLESMAADHSHKSSDAALWMLLLLRLTNVTTDDRLELRNSAIQTLLRIFDAYGERLSPESWSICVKSVVFKLLSSIEQEIKVLQSDEEEEADDGERAEWTETAVVVLNGISSLLANYLDILTVHPSFNQLWQELLTHFTSLLDFEVLGINTAIFKALAHILSGTNDEGKSVFSETAIDVAWDLWARGVPTSKPINDKAEDNQSCLIAYVSALTEIYRLVQEVLEVKRVGRILNLLRKTLDEASVGSYVQDIEYMTPLQAHILEAVQMIRTDIEGVPSAMIAQVADFVILPFVQADLSKPGPKRTYIALSKASMKTLEKLILEHSSDFDIYCSDSFYEALKALCKPITLKYGFCTVTKSTQPWRLATSTALSILEATLSQITTLELPAGVTQNIWTTIVAIVDGIVSADCGIAPPNPDFADDESFDIESFHKLRELIIPSIGAAAISEKVRKAYAESLFRTSVIHAPSHDEESIINGTHEKGLSALYAPRAGRTVSVTPTKRVHTAYVVCEVLFTLVAAKDEPTIVIQPPTPKFPDPKQSRLAESPVVLHARIASTAAPFLILRCALTLRAYIADQPLRGKMPQPLSQRKELLWILRKLVDLKSDKSAIPELSNIESEGRKHLLRLYPLIVRASGVAGDEKVGSLLREALEVVGDELGF
ncbi:related to MON2 Peripheral membrane protein with a role in endocytosis and vacuole integrity [Fusarium torulosum]|uniref:Related to MON2 Peripheral membrane protein with a role in endocytosis and vacuole integrity n=1 Tax=Fusarium torulosum TaxID=33205 RepID=A0AAE8M808_9HYPO|nr:related to MON2 Peripheral membrane protein with a role in endocytosis and vacuole integrity [Fusarium torulosum]